MRRDDLADLATFAVVAEEASFTRAAARLGLSQSALSHAMRKLEERLGLRLLTRTTRRVSTTEAGERLLSTLRPAIDTIDQQLNELSELRDTPSGNIRITASEHAAQMILWPVIDRFLQHYPDVQIELATDYALTDIVAERFDAGVRLGEQVARDMIAVRIGPPMRMAVIATPDYFDRHGKPLVPHDVTHHICINQRQQSSGGLLVWEFEKDGKEINVRVEGNIIVNSTLLVMDAVRAGHGLAYVMENRALPFIESGEVVRVLDEWCEPFDGYHLYYPSRRQPTPAFKLLVEALRYTV